MNCIQVRASQRRSRPWLPGFSTPAIALWKKWDAATGRASTRNACACTVLRAIGFISRSSEHLARRWGTATVSSEQ